MQTVDDEIETVHLYIVRKVEKAPYTVLPLLCALLFLVGVVAVVLYSAEHPYYQHERLAVPAIFLPLKVLKAEAPIIPTGVKTYPATTAHGFLTFSNGSVIGQSVPAGFIVDGATTDAAIYVPAATANGFGVSTVSAHLLTSGVNLPTLSVNEVIGSSLFIRNLTPFIGGRPTHLVIYVTDKDKLIAALTARSILAAQVNGYHYPCAETKYTSINTSMHISWRCQFLTFKVPSYMRIVAATLVGKNFLVDVVFVPRPKPVWVR